MRRRTDRVQDARAIRQAAILVGGLGSRLGALTEATPKPLLPVAGKPFLYWIIRELCRFGIAHILLLAGHMADRVRAAVPGIRAALPRDMQISVVEDQDAAGTGGALVQAARALDARFLLCNGDSIFGSGIAELLAAALSDTDDVVGRMLLRDAPDAARFGVVGIDGERITSFQDRPTAPGRALINAGIGVFDRRMLSGRAAPCSLERDILPALAAGAMLRGTVAQGWFLDIGIPEDYARAQRDLLSALSRPAVFLDRDGVINIDHGYVGTRARFTFVAGALDAIRLAHRAGWHVFAVTNQSGVARGFYTEDDVRALHEWVAQQVLAHGGTIDDWRFCPFHPDAAMPAYRRPHPWRKPEPGMILDLIRAWSLDTSQCLLIGDQATDMLAAQRAGIAAYRFDGGDLAALLAPLLQRVRDSVVA